MKRCPTCNKTFTDQSLTFCVDDGTPLETIEEPRDDAADEATLVRPAAAAAGSAASSGLKAPAYQPPGSYVPPDYAGAGKRKNWPWVLGLLAFLLLLIAGLAVAGAIVIPNLLRAQENRNANSNPGVSRSSPNSNLNSANQNSNSAVGNDNANDNSDLANTPPPTDQAQVLADLTDLEHEWTVANINADKQKLARILADDYVGTTEGKAQGKAEYLKTIKPDTAIQHWNFDDLKVSLQGDRASLTGTITLLVRDPQGQDHEVVFRFTDKFVWRDGRWQATGSIVDPVKSEAAV